MTVVAEGVEDEVALDMLIGYGCDSAQGYFFSRPQPAEEMTEWLVDSPFGATVRAVAIPPVASAGLTMEKSA